MATHQYAVEFIGGPFDGHKQLVSIPPHELSAIVVLPVSEHLMRMLIGERRVPETAPTSAAVYELEIRDGKLRYRHLCATAATELVRSWLS